MRIAKVWCADYPWDVRVEKICKTMSAAGHEVHLTCRNLGLQPTIEVREGIHIHRLRPFQNRTLNDHISFPAFFNPLWVYKVWRVVRDNQIHVMIVRDLPLALTAILIGKLCRVPVVFDMAENYPAMLMETWKYEDFHVINIFVRNPYIARFVEWLSVRWADHILVVVEESKRRLEGCGVDPLRISVVSNTPELKAAYIRDCDLTDREQDDMNSKFVITYVGGLENSRGLVTVVKAMADITDHIKNALLVIIGSGTGEIELKRLVHELHLERSVVFKGWIAHDRVFQYIDMSDVCVIPHPSSAHTNSTVPNKLFDYMARGKAVLASDAVPLRRILCTENCGLIFESGNVASFVRGVLRLQDPSYRELLGKNGRKAVEDKYNWSRDAPTLLAVINSVAADRGTMRKPITSAF